MSRYFFNIGIGIDQFLNTLLNGEPDETLSARAWRNEQNGKLFGKLFRPLIDFLFILILDFDHCEKSYISEIERTQLPKHYRD